MIDWNENAKAAVREFADYIGQSDKCERYLEYVTTNKTVADAYEKCKGLWPNKYCNGLYYDPKSGEWFCNDKPAPWYIFVCTREQFEAYVKEQDGEKWTHEFDNCKPRQLRIVCSETDCNGEIVVLVDGPHGDLYCKVLPSKIKPIKPTITKTEAWDILNKIDGREEFEPVMKKVMGLHKQYDII